MYGGLCHERLDRVYFKINFHTKYNCNVDILAKYCEREQDATMKFINWNRTKVRYVDEHLCQVKSTDGGEQYMQLLSAGIYTFHEMRET